MRAHHLNCATLCPPSRRLVNGTGSLFEAAELVCHCLLVETSAGLVLVDTGLGTADITNAHERLGGLFLSTARPELDARETAIRQVERHGFRPEDVRHIVLTHLDIDHAGGLSDFPWATVHVMKREKYGADQGRPQERRRYRKAQWAHGPKWQFYEGTGEPWFGFEAVRNLVGLPPEVLFVPLHGHTRGHTGVAVNTKRGWLLHCGDAYFHHEEVQAERPRATPMLDLLQRLESFDNKLRVRNQARLRELKQRHADEVAIFSSHCPVELAEQEARARAFATHPPPRAPSPAVP